VHVGPSRRGPGPTRGRGRVGEGSGLDGRAAGRVLPTAASARAGRLHGREGSQIRGGNGAGAARAECRTAPRAAPQGPAGGRAPPRPLPSPLTSKRRGRPEVSRHAAAARGDEQQTHLDPHSPRRRGARAGAGAGAGRGPGHGWSRRGAPVARREALKLGGLLCLERRLALLRLGREAAAAAPLPAPHQVGDRGRPYPGLRGGERQEGAGMGAAEAGAGRQARRPSPRPLRPCPTCSHLGWREAGESPAPPPLPPPSRLSPLPPSPPPSPPPPESTAGCSGASGGCSGAAGLLSSPAAGAPAAPPGGAAAAAAAAARAARRTPQWRGGRGAAPAAAAAATRALRGPPHTPPARAGRAPTATIPARSPVDRKGAVTSRVFTLWDVSIAPGSNPHPVEPLPAPPRPSPCGAPRPPPGAMELLRAAERHGRFIAVRAAGGSIRCARHRAGGRPASAQGRRGALAQWRAGPRLPRPTHRPGLAPPGTATCWPRAARSRPSWAPRCRPARPARPRGRASACTPSRGRRTLRRRGRRGPRAASRCRSRCRTRRLS
jgi:hypothetical protein